VSDIEKVEIGMATLYRGDCLEVMSHVDKFDHCIMDPPYEASMHTKNRIVKSADGWGTSTEPHKFGAMDEHTRSEITRMIVEKCGGWVMIFCQSEGSHYWNQAIVTHGGKYRFTGVWVKPSSKPNMSGDSPGLGYESVVGGWCPGGRSVWNGGGRAAVWTHNPERRSIGNNHTSIKPQGLMTELVGLFTNDGQTVLDAFMGSGSTGVAAISMGRRFIGVERDPEYFKICCRRIEEAQKGGMHDNKPYVRVKSQVTVPMFEELQAKKVAAPKARAPAKPAPAAKPAKAVATKRSPAAPRAKFTPPTISTSEEELTPDDRPRLPLPSVFDPIIAEHGSELIDFGPWDDDAPRSAVGLDVECFRNCFIINLKNFSNGQKISFEMSERSSIDFARLMRILSKHCIITFNGASYDIPMIALAKKGLDEFALKECSNRLVSGQTRYWEIERTFKVRLPVIDHVDLYDTSPAIHQSLKTIAGRLHCKTIMDLPYKHDKYLTREEMNVVSVYCFIDIDDTEVLFKSLKEPLTLRVALGKEYGLDLRSRSDAQVGEAIVKKRAERILNNKKLKKMDLKTSWVSYVPPPFIKFQGAMMQGVLAKLKTSQFDVDGYSKLVTPEWMKNFSVTFGNMTYSMGKGGLHSTEANRALHSDNEYFLLDVDVSSQYPRLLLLLGMYPKAIGPTFLKVYKAIIDERLAAKDRLKVLKGRSDPALMVEASQVQQKSEGGKIQVNGVFGKLGSKYSILFAPDMLIATTLTGQLSLLMLIEAAKDVGISVVSANTDGIVFRCRRDRAEELDTIIERWESGIGFQVERTYYKSIYSSSVNTYMAFKEDGEVKVKGPQGDPWSDNSTREMIMKNPQMTVLTEAVINFINDGVPFEDTIRACTDVHKFITINNVKTGAEWRGGYLGKTVRFYWSTDGDPIRSVGGSRRQVSNTLGSKPLMTLPDQLPEDIDYKRYVAEATEVAYDIAALEKPTMFNKGKAK